MSTKATLLEIYNALATGEITKEEAAQTLGFTDQQLKLRMTKWGHRLPLLLATLDKIKADAIGRDEASQILGVSAREVNKLQESWKIARPLKKYLIERAATQIKWELRKKYAIDFIAGGMELEEAAAGAGVSTRQIRRWVSDLLKKHYEMTFKELGTLADRRRKRLADEIETAENLEIAKQQVLKSISDGHLSIEEEARKRVLSKRTIGRRINDVQGR